MKFYHIDRLKLIKHTGDIKLQTVPQPHPLAKIFPAVSEHGVHYLLHEVPEKPSLETELVLEYVRAMLCPEMPSRFVCLFAVREKSQLNPWLKYCNSDFNLLEIEADKFYELDASWFSKRAITEPQLTATMRNLNVIHHRAIALTFEEAARYWCGLRSTAPLMEALIPLPCRVVKIDYYKAPQLF